MFVYYRFDSFEPFWAFFLLVVVLILYFIVRALHQAYATPLRDVPGPWLARYTRLWQLQAVNARSFHKVNIALHKKYGSPYCLGHNYELLF